MVLGKRLLKPQEETILRIIYHTKDLPGPYEKKIYLSTDISGEDFTVITIKGLVLETSVAKIKVDPKKIQLGTIKRESAINIDLNIVNEGIRPLVITKIQNIETAKNYFDADKQGSLVIGPNASMVFRLPFYRDAPGPFIEVIFIESNAQNAPQNRYAIMLMGGSEEN